MKRRTLIHLPIIHTTQDMGNLGDSIHQAAASAFGSRSTIRKDRFVDQIWAAVERTVDSMDLSSHKVRLHQDGLPICGREMEIVADLAEAGSRNHRLLMRMIHSGAVLMGTESPELLLEEYHLIKQAVSGWHDAKCGKESPEKPEGPRKNKITLSPSRLQVIFARSGGVKILKRACYSSGFATPGANKSNPNPSA